MASEGNVLVGFTKWILKWILIVIGSLVGLGFAVGGGAYVFDWWTVRRYESDIKLVVSNGNHCTDDKRFPIFIGYVNGTPKAVEYLNVRVRAYIPDRSSEILSYSEASFDNIVKPNEGIGGCYSFRVRSEFKDTKNLDKAIYTAEIKELRFWSGFRGTQ